jgi:membrane protein DedA with SNARE-associated domain
MLHEWIKIWFEWVHDWGYWGVFILMAMESSIIPVPSELVMPPAAYWATQGKMSFNLVVLAGTLGSYFGSIVNYFLFRWLGTPFVEKYGRYFLISRQKYKAAQQWMEDFGSFGVFIARLLPVIRHLISIPAGILKMNFTNFSIATLVGAGIWCYILSWFGEKTLGAHPELLDSPEAMMRAVRTELVWFVIGIVIFSALYLSVTIYKKKSKRTA